MMQNEFEALIGHSVTPEVFNTANVMYMESTLDKQDFVKEYKKHHLAESVVVKGLLQALYKADETRKNLNAHISNITEALSMTNQATARFLIEEDRHHSSDSLRTKAIELIGGKGYIKTKIALGHDLSKADAELIDSLLK